MKLRARFLIFLILIITISGIIIYDNINKKKSHNSPISPFSTINQGTQAIQETINISFVGDILLASHVEGKINQAGVNYPFEKVSNLLSKSDFTMGNLESAVGLSGTPAPNKQYTFRADPMVLEGVRSSGIDLLSIANNHVLDYGTSAFYETLRNIESYDLHYVGGGRDKTEAFKPVVFDKNGNKIVFFAASRVVPSVTWHAGKNSPGVAGIYDYASILESLKDYKQEDIIIVYLHWGIERKTNPESYQRKLARLLIDNGADVVVGSHPHVLQGFEFYKEGLIAYSLGNFVFTNKKNNSIILTANFDRKGFISAEIIPCIINNYRPEPLEGNDAKQSFYEAIEEISFGVIVNNEGKLERILEEK